MNDLSQIPPATRADQLKAGVKAKKIPLTIIAITVVLVSLMMATRPKPPVTAKQERSWPVSVTAVTVETLAPQLDLLGRVEAPLSTTLTSTLSADVAAVPAREGARLEAGAVLVQLDDREARLMLNQRDGDVAELSALIAQERNRAASDKQALTQEKALVDIAQRAVDRESSLAKSKLNSANAQDLVRQNLETRQLAVTAREQSIADHPFRLAQLEARLTKARAQQDLAKLDLERTQIRAPFHGAVSTVHASVGQRLRVGDPVVIMYSIDRLEVRAQIPDHAVGTVRTALANGAMDAVSMTAFGPVEMTLKRVSSEIRAGAGGLDALFEIRGTATDLPPGKTVSVRLTLPPQADVVAVPVSSLYGTDRIYKVVDDRLVGVTVSRVGTRQDDNIQHLLVRSPELSSGDRIITTQLPNAVNGLRVGLNAGATP